jgi:hypothetical protein
MAKRVAFETIKDSDLGDLERKLTNYGAKNSPGVARYGELLNKLSGRVESGQHTADYYDDKRTFIPMRFRRKDRKLLWKSIKGLNKQKKRHVTMEQEIIAPKIKKMRRRPGPKSKTRKPRKPRSKKPSVRVAKVKTIVNSMAHKMRQLINHTHLHAPGTNKARKRKAKGGRVRNMSGGALVL